MGLNLLTSHPEVLTTCRFHLMLDVPGAVPLVDGKFTDCLGMKAVSYTHLTLPTNREV